MENRSPYVLVGAAVLVFVMALTGFVIWKLRAGSEQRFVYYEVIVGGDVQGLTVDSSVFYRGIRVGRVHSISLRRLMEPTRRGGPPRPVERISVVIGVDPLIDIREQVTAVIERPLVTGAAFLQIVPPAEETGAIKPKKTLGQTPYPEIREAPSVLQSATATAQNVAAKVGLIAERIQEALSPETIKAFNQLMENLATVSGAIARTEPALTRTLNELPETLAEVRRTMEKFAALSARAELIVAELGPQDEATRRALAGRTPGEMKQAMGHLREALANVNAAAGNLNRTVAENRAPVRQFTEGGLVELSKAIRDLRTLIASLNAISARLDRDPAGYLLGGSKQGYSPK